MVRDFPSHFSGLLLILVGNIICNWLSTILWTQIGLDTNPITKALPGIVVGTLFMYALYKTHKEKANKGPDNWPAVSEGNQNLLSQGAILSLMTTLFAWCGDKTPVEQTAILVLSLVPYAQGVWGASAISRTIDRLYTLSHNFLEARSKSDRQIRQRWLYEHLREDLSTRNIDDQTLQRFTAHKMQLWACLLYTSPSPRDVEESRMPSSA